jgi:excisionase family DNA binding protein
MTDPPILYSPRQLCSVLSISRSTLYLLIASGEIDSFNIGRSRRFSREQVVDFIEKMKTHG